MSLSVIIVIQVDNTLTPMISAYNAEVIYQQGIEQEQSSHNVYRQLYLLETTPEAMFARVPPLRLLIKLNLESLLIPPKVEIFS